VKKVYKEHLLTCRTMKLVTNICGCFAVDDDGMIIDFMLHDGRNEKDTEGTMTSKHKAERSDILDTKALGSLRGSCPKDVIVALTIKKAKSDIKRSVSSEVHIIQAIKNIDDLQRVTNHLAKRLREWYGYYSPEVERAISDHKTFAELIRSKSRDTLLSEVDGPSAAESMGADFPKNLLDPMMNLADELLSMYKLADAHTAFLEEMMQQICPNTTAVAGALIGAKLIELAGSIKRLAMFPASTVQTLGAEKALFRHLRSNSRPPKHGVLIKHPILVAADKCNKGKVARALANKISLACRVDYYGGDPYLGYAMREELEKRFKV